MTDETPIPVDGTYDPQLLSIRDQMRSRVGDTGPDFMIPDVTYDAMLRIEGEWRLATAAIALQLAALYEQDPNSYTATGEFSAGWVDRGKALRQLAASLQAEVARERERDSSGYSMRSIRAERADEDDAGEYTLRRRRRR